MQLWFQISNFQTHIKNNFSCALQSGESHKTSWMISLHQFTELMEICVMVWCHYVTTNEKNKADML